MNVDIQSYMNLLMNRARDNMKQVRDYEPGEQGKT